MQEATELTSNYLEPYLRALWKDEGVKIASIVKFPRGMSRETWFVECAGAAPNAGAKHPHKLILRRDLPSISVVPQTLRYEYEIYRRLQGSAVPVAATLVYETDPARLPDDRPFYLREQIDGSWEVPHYFDPDPAYDTLRVEAAKEHVRKLAAIHTLDWKTLGFGELMQVPKGTDDCAHAAIERNLAELAKFQFEPMPVMTEAQEWLHDHAPTAPRVSLLKGTNGLGEEVFREGRIVAMSDWEQASLGDPASDFARTQDFLTDIVHNGETVWSLQHALDYYAEQSGITIPVSSVDYYRTLNGFENIVALHHAASAIVDQSDLLVRLAWLSTEVMHYGQLLLLSAIGNRTADAASAFYSTKTGKHEA